MASRGNRHNGEQESRGILAILGSSLLFAPFKVLNLVAVNGVSVLRPYAPQLVPIAVCLFLVPFAISLSLYAGWSVWKSLAVGWDVPLYLQYGQTVAPYASATLPPIQAAQPYDISLHMRVPITESNMALGNFMATLTLATSSNETLVTVSRSCIVVPQTTSWFFWSSSIANIDTIVLSSFIAKTSYLLARVEIGRQDGWRTLGDGRGREVSILSASLRAREIPRGIRGLAIRSPLIASTLAASLFFLILSFIVTSCVLPSMFPFPVDHTKTKDEVDERESKHKLTDLPSTGNTRPRSSSTTLRLRRSKLTRRRSSTSRNVS
ncbi:hypothetical protein AGABI2DRAFT_75106 [Agaricus bisporus var. bisporus H97]|uniref:hypothetical protein n=1 Tax=Agaricus bisporus var. bisporus (strain H97 / ATCC MYA-4626 / FGSC 10389) TaxID=936046 RepID=UPI00029F543D|nr:hypothetical protein AGABI2DRAFT_75106 [Agaricus bisporus var. bisporus H97]EKV44633.1 hypothetical protein AGABI2DRAFT_75106 [Agaricus bisporus var. bisporus H97]